MSATVFDESAALSTWHAYPASAMLGDYLRAAAGFVPSAIVLATVPLNSGVAVVLACFAAVFALFGLRTALRHGSSLELTETGLRASGIAHRSIMWSDLDRMRLAYYSVRRDRKAGWMQLQLRAGGVRLGLDSRIAGFGRLVERAAEAAAARGLELSDPTLANLDALGVHVPPAAVMPSGAGR